VDERQFDELTKRLGRRQFLKGFGASMLGVFGMATGTQVTAAQPDKAYICHATGSARNPYVLLHVPTHSAHFTKHAHDVEPTWVDGQPTCPSGAEPEPPSGEAEADDMEETRREHARLRVVTYHCPTKGEPRTVFEELKPGVEHHGEACARAANISFALIANDGAVIVQAATDGLGQAEVALPPGTYTLREESLQAATEITVTLATPLTLAVVLHGAVPLAPESERDSEGARDVPLREEQQQTLAVAEPPPTTPEADERSAGATETPETTGAIVVHKHACDVDEPTPDIDWQMACHPETTKVVFQLTPLGPTEAQLPSIGLTAGGSVSFDRLPPGRYQLGEIGQGWCYGEADHVDAEGMLLVEAGRSTTVRVFNCAHETLHQVSDRS
jgi:hypothetical protein